MVRQSLWAEIVICGFLYFIGFVLIVIDILNIKNLNFLSLVKDYLTITTLATLIMSYFLGFMMHRLLYSLGGLWNKLFTRLPSKKEKKDLTKENEESLKMTAFILQHGSDKIQKEIEFQSNNFVVSRLSAVGFLFLGFISFFWLKDSDYSIVSFHVAVFFILIGLAFIWIYFKLKSYLEKLRMTCYHVVKNSLKIKINE